MSTGYKVFLLLAVAATLIWFSSSSREASSGQSRLMPKQTPVQSVTQSTPKQLTLATKCGKVLKEDGAAYWSNYHTDKNGAFVVLKPAFFALKFDDREMVHQAFRCVVTQGRMDDSVDFISYEDPYTNEQVGSWSPTLGLRFDR